MKIPQEALNTAIENFPKHLLADLLGEKLAANGVRLSRRQLEKLARQAINEKLDSIDLPWWQFWRYLHFRQPKELLIEFTPEDSEKITATLDEFAEKRLPELVQRIIEDQPEIILSSLRKHWKSELKRQLREEDGFRYRLQIRWGAPIEELRLLLTIARELGSEINRLTAARHGRGEAFNRCSYTTSCTGLSDNLRSRIPFIWRLR